MNQIVRLIAKLVVVISVLWCAAIAFLYFNQDSMIFPVPSARTLPANSGFEAVALKSPDGETLNAAIHPAQTDEAWVIVFHGNGGDVVQMMPEASVFAAAGYGVLIAEYRGYNGSSGSPSMTGVYSDALTAFDHVRSSTDQPIYLYAHSLGTAMAVHVAQYREAAGMALLSPFDSVLAVAQARYPLFPLHPFLKHPFLSVEKIGNVEEPTIIFHGDKDQVVPITHGRTLYAAAPSGTKFQLVKGANHNDLFQRGVTTEAVTFFNELGGGTTDIE